MSANATKRAKFPIFPRTDKRLLGTWKSDKKRTFAEWNWGKCVSPKRKARLKSFFGKLEITYTRTKVISVLRHRKWEQARKYAVLANDDASVAIVQFGKMEVKDRRGYDLANLEFLENFSRNRKLSTSILIKSIFGFHLETEETENSSGRFEVQLEDPTWRRIALFPPAILC
jgi:hypothetical protein